MTRHLPRCLGVTSSRYTVTRSDAVTCNAGNRSSRGQICKKRVGEEQDDSLYLLIVVAACGALIASLGDLPQIMLAHLYRQFAEPAAPLMVMRSSSQGTRSMTAAISAKILAAWKRSLAQL